MKVGSLHLEHVHQDLVEIDLRVVAVVNDGSLSHHALFTRGRGKIGCRRLCSRWNGWLRLGRYRRGSGLGNWLGDRRCGLDRSLFDGLLDRLRDGRSGGLSDRRCRHRWSLAGLGCLGYCLHGWLLHGRLLHSDHRGSGVRLGRLRDGLRDRLLGGRRWRRFALGHGDEREFFLRQRHGEPPRWWSCLGRL